MSVYQNTLPNAQDALRAAATATLNAMQAQQQALVTAQSYEATTDVDGILPGYGQAIRNQQASVMNTLAAAFQQGGPVIGMFAPLLLVNRSLADVLRLREYMGANSFEVKSLGLVYGAASPGGGNVGTQQMIVQSVDRWNQINEGVTVETFTLTCLGSAQDRSQWGLETYEVRGQDARLVAQRFPLEDTGIGILPTLITGVGPALGANQFLVVNNSFDSPFTTADASSATKIPGWFISAGASNITYSDTVYAQNRGGTPASLKIDGNCTIQFFFAQNNVALPNDAPFIGGLSWRAGGAYGTITVRVGPAGSGGFGASVVTSDTSGVFTVLPIAEATADDAWAPVFNTNSNPVFEIEVSGWTTGSIYIDDVFLTNYTPVGGRWIAVVAGITPAVLGDSFTQAVTMTAGAGSVELTGGGSGSVDSILVGGVELLPEAVPYNTSLAQTATDVITAINAVTNRTAPAYVASSGGSGIIDITQVVPVEGTITVVSTATTITTSDTNITGAVYGSIQNAVRLASLQNGLSPGGYLPHASSATSGWEDPS